MILAALTSTWLLILGANTSVIAATFHSPEACAQSGRREQLKRRLQMNDFRCIEVKE